MHFAPTSIDGVHKVEIAQIEDERGFFARVFCEEEFARAGLAARFPQSSVSWNAKRGTLRGMHYSVAPAPETKLVRCTAGRIFDVVVDLRRNSPTFGLAEGFELSASSHEALYVPSGVAHGFQTLEEGCEVLYMIDMPCVAAAARGLRFNDPIVTASIRWPLPVTAIAERDRTYADFRRDVA